jgi:hypothetical protein
MLTHLQVELLSWKSNKDLTGDGGIIKTTTREGKGWDHAKNRDEVVGEHSSSLHFCASCCSVPQLHLAQLPAWLRAATRPGHARVEMAERQPLNNHVSMRLSVQLSTRCG